MMLYLFQTTCYSAILFGVYLLFLKDRVIGFARAYLIVAAMLPFVLPFLQYNWQPSPQMAQALPSVLLPTVVVGAQSTGTSQAESVPWLAVIYGVIVLVLVFRVLISAMIFSRRLRKQRYQKLEGARLYVNTGFGPGSWGRAVFLPQENADAAIIKHELAHVRLKHSWDMVFMQVLLCLFWPNLILYFIRRELRLVHEFQADRLAADAPEAYSATLLSAVFGATAFPLAHSFFLHPIKRRIAMLKHPIAPRRSKRLRALTLAAASIFIGSVALVQGCQKQEKSEQTIAKRTFSSDKEFVAAMDSAFGKGNLSPEKEAELKKYLLAFIEKVEKEHPELSSEVYEGAYSYVEQMPEFAGDISSYLGKSLTYPAAAKKQNIQGRVIVKFVVDKDGTVTRANVIRGANPMLDAEALRVVNAMPKWKPGKNAGQPVAVWFTLPITFKLEG